MTLKSLFVDKSERTTKYLLFIDVGVVGVLLNGLLLWVFTELVGIHYLRSKGIAAVTVFFCNFFARKFLLLR